MNPLTYLKSLGTGLLFAGAAVGVSHLVQSTRAGADFGLGLLWALLLVNLFKYPFFRFGATYASATGKTLVEGYYQLGKPFLAIYFILSFATMFTIQAAVTIVTAGLAANLFGMTPNLVVWSLVITLISFLVLVIGRYKLLDKVMKYVILILTICTLIAVFVAGNHTTNSLSFQQVIPNSTAGVTFLIAFLGWMPAPLDVSIWQSIWNVEKSKISTSKPTYKQSLFDFNVGYLGTITLGICFVLLGAWVMFKSGESFSDQGGAFAGQLINLYTKHLGNNTYYIIAIAAFTTMFSTTLTALDASPRAMKISSKLLFQNTKKIHSYTFWIALLSIGTIIILQFFLKNMGTMVKVATILSFLTAPFYALANFLLVTGKTMPTEYKPKKVIKVLSFIGILFLIGFSIWYLTFLFEFSYSKS